MMSENQYSCYEHDEYDADCCHCWMNKNVSENQETYDTIARAEEPTIPKEDASFSYIWNLTYSDSSESLFYYDADVAGQAERNNGELSIIFW